ncbi:MAG: hypothetical protein SF339_12625 [Blastocatellia bacterium]|nr:hypothetical protein [Blastocatellia bacterium]
MSEIVFSTERFAPGLPEECQVNPNVLGFELACWLGPALAKDGFVTSYPHPEDWGWYLDYSREGKRFMIGCAGSRVEGEQRYEWRIFIEEARSLFRPGKGASAEAEAVMRAVLRCLEAEGVSAAFE